MYGRTETDSKGACADSSHTLQNLFSYGVMTFSRVAAYMQMRSSHTLQNIFSYGVMTFSRVAAYMQMHTSWRWRRHDVNRQKMYVWKCTPSEDSDQLAHSRSLIRIFTGSIMDSQGCKFFHVDNEDSDQTARMRRLIWVIAVRTCKKVRFLTLWFTLFQQAHYSV